MFGVLVFVVRTKYHDWRLLSVQSLTITFRVPCREFRFLGWAVRVPGVDMLRFWVRVFGIGGLSGLCCRPVRFGSDVGRRPTGVG